MDIQGLNRLRFTPEQKPSSGRNKRTKFKSQSNQTARDHYHTVSYNETGLKKTMEIRY